MLEEEGQESEIPPEVTGAGTEIEVTPDPPAETQDDQQPKPSRKERREGRGRDLANENREILARAERAEREAQATRELVAELRGRVEAGEKLRTPAADPNEARLTSIATEIEDAVAEMGKGLPGAVKRWHDLRREEARLVARMEAGTIAKESEERIAKAMPQRGDPRADALAVEFPFLQDNEGARQVANGHANRLAIMEKRDMSNPEVKYATLREAAALAARDLGLQGARAAPTAADRERVSGTRGGDTGAGNGGAVKVHLTSTQMALAEQCSGLPAFAGLSREQLHQKWWQVIGSKQAK